MSNGSADGDAGRAGALVYGHLGRFSDWVDYALRQRGAYSPPCTSRFTPSNVRDAIGFATDRCPIDPRVDGTWSHEGVVGESVSWSVGYGPRTEGWLLRPDGVRGQLPGVLALHDHSHFKFFGKEKIADGPDAAHALVVELRRQEYGGRAFANELARRGFAVLVHDTFLWGSRRFDMEEMVPPDLARSDNEWVGPGLRMPASADEVAAPGYQIRSYNRAAIQHEHVVAKYCSLLRTSLAGVVAYEDRVAVEYLKSRQDILSNRVGCVGLSGGGCRAALLQATCLDIAAAVVVCMMSTYERLLDRHVAPHTWMLFPAGLAQLGDWPDLAACRAPSPLVVQYALGDQLFPVSGMTAAHERIAEIYAATGAPRAYVGQFFDGGHSFDQAMQAAAFAQLARWLGAP